MGRSASQLTELAVGPVVFDTIEELALGVGDPSPRALHLGRSLCSVIEVSVDDIAVGLLDHVAGSVMLVVSNAATAGTKRGMALEPQQTETVLAEGPGLALASRGVGDRGKATPGRPGSGLGTSKVTKANLVPDLLYDAYRIAYFPPRQEKDRKHFDRRLTRSSRDAISCLYECLVLALLKCSFVNLRGVEVNFGGSTRPDFFLHTIDGKTFVVEVKTIFDSEKLRTYDSRCVEYSSILENALKRNRFLVHDFEVLVTFDQIPKEPKDIKRAINATIKGARIAKVNNKTAVSVEIPYGGRAIFRLKKSGGKNPFLQAKLDKLEDLKDHNSRRLGRLKLELEHEGYVQNDFSRRLQSSIGKKAGQLASSGSSHPNIIAVCIGDPTLSVRNAVRLTRSFLRGRVLEEDKTPYSAVLFTSFFEPDVDSMYSKIDNNIVEIIRNSWSRFPIAKVDALIAKIRYDIPILKGIKTVDSSVELDVHEISKQNKLPTAALFWKQVLFDTRLDPRLLEADNSNSNYVVFDPNGRPICGWSGIENTLECLVLSVEDMYLCSRPNGNWSIDDLIVRSVKGSGTSIRLADIKARLVESWIAMQTDQAE